jgi:phage recombination protein Bet
MSTALMSLTQNLASRFELGAENSQELMNTLKSTAFKVKEGVVSDAQMTALMIVAQQYSLNPWTKEIYAYPDKQNGIVPVVGVDGWSRIVNDHPQLDGIEFNYSQETLQHKGKTAHEWIECVITRKDRSRPIVVREYFDEVCRSLNFTTPWDSHPKRMHRHKALIQCARVAFGFGGIYDQDEAERLVEIDVQTGEIIKKTTQAQKYEKPALEYCPDDRFEKNTESWQSLVQSGKKSAEHLIAMVETKYLFTNEQKEIIKSWGAQDEAA